MVWHEPVIELRIPYLFHLQRDPFEKAYQNSNTYWDWYIDRVYVLVPMQALAGEFLQTFIEFPPSQKPGAFNLEKIIEQLKQGAASK